MLSYVPCSHVPPIIPGAGALACVSAASTDREWSASGSISAVDSVGGLVLGLRTVTVRPSPLLRRAPGVASSARAVVTKL